ncbi:MAG: hypothetical protein JOS17DRAFT_765876 [Linnemannia elongata]|nr:MAG: hypothetical protein JOS17DRAFT_765876 [Linnemannia elongata]
MQCFSPVSLSHTLKQFPFLVLFFCFVFYSFTSNRSFFRVPIALSFLLGVHCIHPLHSTGPILSESVPRTNNSVPPQEQQQHRQQQEPQKQRIANTTKTLLHINPLSP